MAAELVHQAQRQYDGIRSIGPVCEITHTDIEPMTRRLVTCTVPLPPDYYSKKGAETRLVIVSGTSGQDDSTEVVEKVLVKSHSCVEFLTRYLTWYVLKGIFITLLL